MNSLLCPNSDILYLITQYMSPINTIRYLQSIFDNGCLQNSYVELISKMHFIITDEFKFNDIKFLGSMTDIRKLSCIKFKNEMMSLLSTLTNMTNLSISMSNVDNRGLFSLNHLTNLEHLELRSSKTIDIGTVREIFRFTNLTYLDLSENKNILDGYEFFFLIKQFKKLKHLDIHSMTFEISNHAIQYLTELKNLTYINLSYNSISQNTDLGLLSSLPNLKNLDLSTINISKQQLKALHLLTNLTHIDLSDIYGINFKWLSELTNLEYIDLSRTGVDDINLKSLTKLINLKTILLHGTPITSIEPLRYLTNIEILSLSYTEITDFGLKYISSLSNLNYISLANTNISDSGIKFIASNFNIEKIDLIHVSISDIGIQSLIQMPNLKTLFVSRKKNN